MLRRPRKLRMVAMRSAGDGAEGSLEGDDMVEWKMQRTHSGNAEMS